MSLKAQVIEDFYGNDPLLGDNACEELESIGPEAIKDLVPAANCRMTTSSQVELRAERIGKHLGRGIVSHLIKQIVDGTWESKLVAAYFFAGIPKSDEVTSMLIGVLKDNSDVDANRLTIEALGRYGASGWASDLSDFARSGSWADSPRSYDDGGVRSKYHFAKYSSYVLEALTIFAAKAATKEDAARQLWALTEFAVLRQKELCNHTPDAYQLIAGHEYQFTPIVVDELIQQWHEHQDPQIVELCCGILGAIAPIRAGKFLLEVATSRTATKSQRVAASIALGEIRVPEVATRVAEAIRTPGTDRTYLDWAISSLFAVGVSWDGCDEFVDSISKSDTEPSSQLLYSRAVRGDVSVKSLLIGRLDHRDPATRCMGALSLSRLLGSDANQYLQHRANEAADAFERCGMNAALVRAGDLARVNDLHQSLQTFQFWPVLRSIWKCEILDAFRLAGRFDQRARTLWASAGRLSSRKLDYFDRLKNSIERAGSTEAPPILAAPGRKRLFISYSQLDVVWLKRFQTMLSPLLQTGRIDCWDDTKMKPGKWYPQIERALLDTDVALFLVSAHFLASNFVMQHELPKLLTLAEETGVQIVWILIDECLWEETPLADYDGESLKEPLAGMKESRQNTVIKQTCRKIAETLNRRLSE
jgi:hypothetical protein